MRKVTSGVSGPGDSVGKGTGERGKIGMTWTDGYRQVRVSEETKTITEAIRKRNQELEKGRK